MATTNNPQAISFVNQKARPMADTMAQLYLTSKSIVAFWNANSVSAVVPNDSTVILDGAATDGRQIVTGQAITAIVTEAMAVISHYEASTNAVLNQIEAVAVNGQSKF